MVKGYLERFDAHLRSCGLLERKAGSHAIEWFKGPFLPRGYMNEFLTYVYNTKKPLDCLTDKRRFERIYPILEKILQRKQPSLFGTLKDSLNELVDYGNILYKQWKQEKNSGNGYRKISVPKNALRNLLVDYVLPFIKRCPVHSCAHGGEPDWSPKRSLTYHLSMKSSLSFDLKDASDQLTMTYVFDFFYGRLEKLVKGKDKETLIDAAGFLSNICTVRNETNDNVLPTSCLAQGKEGFSILVDVVNKQENILPQGSPISIALFNRIMYPVDKLFYKLAEKQNMKYSRWGDDFILSSSEDKRIESFLKFLGIINDDFKIIPEKMFYQKNPCYLLGHKIENKDIIKISKEEGERIRGEHVSGWGIADYNESVNDLYWHLNELEACDDLDFFEGSS